VLKNLKIPKNDNVLIGFDGADDAAAVRLNNGTVLIQTVDFFTPIVDDAYEFGEIAAANALSDIYAMGGEPLFALNIVGFPINDLPKGILQKILQGGADKAAEAGIPIVGGHSVDDKEPKYGLVVTGQIDEKKMWKNSDAQVGDVIILTKPLGTGIIATATKKGLAPKNSIAEASNSMKTLNKYAADALRNFTPNAVTDITGFGLLGHLKEVCQSSNVSASIDFSKVEFFSSVLHLAKSGIIPGGTKRNLEYVKKFIDFNPNLDDVQKLLTADAQTSGGLLITLPEDQAKSYIKQANNASRIIGQIVARKSKLIYVN
jgi:selenide,water dikinase